MKLLEVHPHFKDLMTTELKLEGRTTWFPRNFPLSWLPISNDYAQACDVHCRINSKRLPAHEPH
jgi:hypothetical protein